MYAPIAVERDERINAFLIQGKATRSASINAGDGNYGTPGTAPARTCSPNDADANGWRWRMTNDDGKIFLRGAGSVVGQLSAPRAVNTRRCRQQRLSHLSAFLWRYGIYGVAWNGIIFRYLLGAPAHGVFWLWYVVRLLTANDRNGPETTPKELRRTNKCVSALSRRNAGYTWHISLDTLIISTTFTVELSITSLQTS